MCLKCGPLIKAIDAYIEKADGDLSDALKEEVQTWQTDRGLHQTR